MFSAVAFLVKEYVVQLVYIRTYFRSRSSAGSSLVNVSKAKALRRSDKPSRIAPCPCQEARPGAKVSNSPEDRPLGRTPQIGSTLINWASD